MPLVRKDRGCSLGILLHDHPRPSPGKPHRPPAKRLSSRDAECLRKILPQLLRGICVTVLDRMVEKATPALHPVVVSIKDFTVGYIYEPSGFQTEPNTLYSECYTLPATSTAEGKQAEVALKRGCIQELDFQQRDVQDSQGLAVRVFC